jgi:hypothetical protein
VNSEFADLPGTPETALRPEDLATLPATAPPAPWRVTAAALLWTDRPDARARAAIDAGVPTEIIGAVVYRRGATVFTHIPFIAVDSAASVVGGRTNWALPKTLASFDGQPAHGVSMAATGGDWRVEATPTAYRLVVPMLIPKLLALVQLGPHHTVWSVRPSCYGVTRLARIDVRLTAAPTLRDWLPSGFRRGILSPQLTMFLSSPLNATSADVDRGDAGVGA